MFFFYSLMWGNVALLPFRLVEAFSQTAFSNFLSVYWREELRWESEKERRGGLFKK